MRRLASIIAMIALVLGLSATSSKAVMPEEAYIASRDAAIAKIKATADAEKRGPTDGYDANTLAAEEQARAALEQQMRAIIGQVQFMGIDDAGTLNLDTLFEGDEGFGLLDGMVYGPIDGKTRIIVTTESLFKRWLHEHRNWWGKEFADMPQEPSAAVKESAFYTQAVLTDSAIIRFAELPVRKPARAMFAFAMLAARTQSEIPAKADEIFLAIAHSGRVFIAYTKEFPSVGPIKPCDAIRRESVDKSSANSEEEFLRCFAEKASQQDSFSAATSAAQHLIEQLVARPN